ncbi:MAG TPA: agmatine deiminase family protein [Candidatus Binatus sp.]|nr:agmatine deiminase family protein [Candidatus Binatus sp.]
MKPVPTPAALGYRMPAEWEPHAATWLAWPHERRDWPGKLAAIPWVYGEVVRHLVPGERVRILVGDAAIERSARRLLSRVGVDLARVDFFRIPTDRSWTRDFCPLFVRRDDGDVALTNWRFNGWAKYPNWKRDDAVPDRLARRLGRRQWKLDVVLEGGSIDVNGRGALLTTEECLFGTEQARNPGMARAEIERALHDHLGVRKVLWLGRGIAGDDTHGHVDDLARFVDERTVVVVAEEDPTDPNYEPLRENRERLERMSDQDGAPLRIVTLPMPAPLVFDGQRLPASYANFYVGNAAVLVPTFNDPRDRQALATVAELFPSRRVVGIHAVDLVWGLGTLHCMTQQEPA